MAGKLARRFDRAFKVAALERMAAGANVSALSRELGVRRKLLYQWRDTVRRGGVEALRGVGRPRSGERVAVAVARPGVAAAPSVAVPDELAWARAQVAALERKIGQQALELDFFAQALQLMNEAGRRPSGPPGAPASTASSGPLRGLLAASLPGIG
jgi:transposase